MGSKVKTRWAFIHEFQFTVRRKLSNYHKMADCMVTQSNHILRLYSTILYNKYPSYIYQDMYLLTLHCSSILHCYCEYIMEKPAQVYRVGK